jgi:anti-sigma factor RsiW
MIAHLSSEQLSEYILGQPGPLVAQHVRNCPACRAEVADFQEALGDFRGAVRVWSTEQAGIYQANTAQARAPWWTPSHQLAWALLIAAVCIIASFIIPRNREDSPAGGDTMLLNQVDNQVSQTVPASMEPLMKLVVQK